MNSLFRFLLIALVFAACNADKEANKRLSVKKTPSISSAKTTPSRNYQQIVVIGRTATELVMNLGDSSKIVATDRSHPKFPNLKAPKVGYDDLLRADYILQHKPQLVLSNWEGSPDAVVDAVQEKGVDYYRFKNYYHLDSTKKWILQVAQLLRRQEQGKALVDSVNTQIRATRKILKERKDSVSVLYIHTNSPQTLLVAGSQTAADAIIRLAGAKNAASEFEGMERLAAEDLELLDPDYILLSDEGRATLEGKFMNLPYLVSSRAFRTGRLITLPEFELVNFGIRAAHSAHQLARLLYVQQYYGPMPYAGPNLALYPYSGTTPPRKWK
ncbi:MAG: ABC transporter substrate-binding protein [Bacteroidia bacterium]|nr:ABC transporter substrate-binding protein [Bacteroidia bacterium]